MKNQKNSHSIKLLSLAIFAALTIIIGTTFSALAQDQPTFKVGDRVEAKPSSTWKKATIVKIMMSANAVVVRMDDEKDSDGAQMEYVTHINNVRPLTETAEEKQTQTEKQAADDKNVDQPAYKVGDRVESGTGYSWKKATIVAFDKSGTAALVRMDDEKDYTGAQRELVTHINNVRPLNETAEEKQTQAVKQAAADKNVGKLRVDAKNTVSADREILECPVEQKPVKNGTRPNAQLLGKLIRCLWEKPATTGMDGAVTMDLTPLQIGTPRKWNPRTDLGGSAGTIVYPVKTTYTQKTFYRERIVVDEYTGVFNCSINPFGEWACGMAENKRKGETKSIPVK